jgi:hypothetical protein
MQFSGITHVYSEKYIDLVRKKGNVIVNLPDMGVAGMVHADLVYTQNVPVLSK